jgi:PPE-repeat protein
MDFAALPPEVNSGLMYTGPGSAPMMTAAASWDNLAVEMYSAARDYGSVIANLTSGPWRGTASASMAAAAAPYASWMSTTAAQAEQAAGQAKAAASAYESAFGLTVPPPVIAANRTLLASLIATNLLGQNTPAIAATEAHYAEMWAQDAAAMYDYAGASAHATTLTPFTPPAPTTNPGGLAGQAAAVAQASGTSAANTQAVLSQLTSAVPTALQGLASPLQATSAATPAASGATGILQSLGITPAGLAGSATGTALSSTGLGGAFGAMGSAGQAFQGIISTQGQIAATQDLIRSTQGEVLGRLGQLVSAGSAGLRAGGGPAAVSAGLGQATSIGGLSVPPGWAAAAPAIRPVAAVLPGTSLGAAAEIEASSSGSLFREMALASMAGRAISGTAFMGRRERVGATPQAHAMPPQSSPGGPARGIAAELRELADLRNSGILTDEEFSEQKRRLLGR